MPIKGINDRIVPRFPQLGKLRKGGERGASGFGADLNHFRFASDRPDVVAAFTAAFGAQPQLIPVYLPYGSVNDNFMVWKEKWTSGGLVHRCDGETMTRWLGSDGKYHEEPKPCPYHGRVYASPEERKKDPPCDEVGRLVCVIPSLFQDGFVGFVTLETHSINDIVSILQTLEQVAQSREDNELGLRGIEFHLRRVQQEVSVPAFSGNGQRQRVKKWMVQLEPAPEWIRIQLELQRRSQLQMVEGDITPLLPDKTETLPEPVITPAVTTAASLPPSGFDPGPDGYGAEDDYVIPPEFQSDPKTQAAPAETVPLEVEKARLAKTPKGVPLGGMTPAQLTEILTWYNTQATEHEKKKPANIDIVRAVRILLDYAEQQDPIAPQLPL